MELFFELLLEFLFELLLEILLEFGISFGVRAVGEALKNERTPNPMVACFGYILIALVLGGLSLFVFPRHFIRSRDLRVVSLVVVPCLVGYVMSLRGRSLKSRGRPVARIDSFIYGFCFALVFAGVRFVWVD